VSTGRLRPSVPAPAATAAAREARAELAASVLDGREHRPITVPRTTIRGALRLLTRSETKGLRAACRAYMRELGIEGPGLEGYVEWREEFNTRLVAIAVRHPDDHARPLADLEEWEACDDDQILAIWESYQDMQADLDPLGEGFVLDQADADAIFAAAKKKDVALLTSYGSQKLARALSTSVAPPST